MDRRDVVGASAGQLYADSCASHLKETCNVLVLGEHIYSSLMYLRNSFGCLLALLPLTPVVLNNALNQPGPTFVLIKLY